MFQIGKVQKVVLHNEAVKNENQSGIACCGEEIWKV